jgi:hypothetical protein
MAAAEDVREKLLAAGFTDHVPPPIVVSRLYRLIGGLARPPRRR